MYISRFPAVAYLVVIGTGPVTAYINCGTGVAGLKEARIFAAAYTNARIVARKAA